MKFTPLKLAMCVSVLVHGCVLSAYYAIRHDPQTARVAFNHERALEIEIISEPMPIEAVVAVKPAVVPETLPPPVEPSPTVEMKPAVVEESNLVLPEKSEAVEDQPQVRAIVSESNTASPPAKIEAAEPPVLEMDGGKPADYFLNPKPLYPVEARRKREEGLVVLAVQVNREGLPDGVQIVQSSRFQRLDEAAVKAVKQWRFTPARMGGQVVASQIEVPIRFKLADAK
jgi:protein TonB